MLGDQFCRAAHVWFLTEERMFEGLLRCKPFLGIEANKVFDKVKPQLKVFFRISFENRRFRDLGLNCLNEVVLSVVCLRVCHFKILENFLFLDSRHRQLCRQTACFEDQIDRLGLVPNLKKYLSGHKFTEDASHRPHINPKAIVRETHQHFGSPVPKRDHFSSVLGHFVLRVQHSRQSKISDLDLTLFRYQYISSFYISVRDVHLCVQIS
jgi:hypothetical protein